MEYHGKLYGKMGDKYFDTSKTSKDWDTLEAENKELREMLRDVQDELENGDTPKVWKIEELLNKKP